ncbi:hydrolase, partial [Escherichia coli]|nr:hydrolase [Escherichia coli]
CFPLDTYPRPAEKSQYEGSRSLWSALDDDIITTEQAREIAIRCHERQIQHQQRWVNHYQNRLIYERAMLDESGGVVTRTQDFEPGGQVFSRGEWLTIIRVNKSNGAVSSVTTPNYSFLGYSGTMKVTPDRITDYKAPSAEEAAVASQAAKRPPVVNYPGEGFREMTKAQWAALPRDCKAVRSVAETEDHGAYRYRRTMDNNFRLVNVYITDMKITEIPQK